MSVFSEHIILEMAVLIVICVISTLTSKLFGNKEPEQATIMNVSMNFTNDVTSIQDDLLWCQLSDIAFNVFALQNKVRLELPKYSSRSLVVVILDAVVWKASLKFINSISNLQEGTQFVYLELAGDNVDYDNVVKVLHTLVLRDVPINSVVVFAKDQIISQLLHTTSTFTPLKWTSVIHLTEWIIISTSSEVKIHLHVPQLNIDFLTVVSPLAPEFISVAQKSRGSDLNDVFSYKTTGHCEMDAVNSYADLSYSNMSNHIRPHPLVHLKSQNSIVAGLRIPAALSARNYTRISFYTYAPNNETIYGGFTVTLLRLMAEVLGFSLNFVMVYDGGGYGEALNNGTVTGITGNVLFVC